MSERAENPLSVQAAQWLSRHEDGPLEPALQREFEAWLDASPHHAVAFARVEAAWERARRLEAAPPPVTAPRATFRRPPWTVAVAALLLLVAGATAWLQLRTDIHETGIGERRAIVLADGSRVEINTASRLRVDYSRDRRDLHLEAGEALFQVASDPARPFVVHAGDTSVRAVGTEFNVRMRESRMVEVTVIEGVVAVDGKPEPRSGSDAPEDVSAHLVEAGEGAMLGAGVVAPISLDADTLEQRVIWRRGLIELRGETLDQAVAEFNRYRAGPLVVGDPRIGSIQVGGTFATDESAKFLDSLQSGFQIRAVEGADGRVYLVSARLAAQ